MACRFAEPADIEATACGAWRSQVHLALGSRRQPAAAPARNAAGRGAASRQQRGQASALWRLTAARGQLQGAGPAQVRPLALGRTSLGTAPQATKLNQETKTVTAQVRRQPRGRRPVSAFAGPARHAGVGRGARRRGPGGGRGPPGRAAAAWGAGERARRGAGHGAAAAGRRGRGGAHGASPRSARRHTPTPLSVVPAATAAAESHCRNECLVLAQQKWRRG